jgi:hypothetical protein
MIEPSQRVAARVYAITCLVTLAMITFAFMRYLGPDLVWNNGEATARNMIAHEAGYRMYLTAAFLNGVGGLAMLVALFVMLRPINRGLALFAAFSQLIYIGAWNAGILLQLLALRTMGGGVHPEAIAPASAPALGGLFLDSGWDAYYIGLPFLALGSALFAWLFFRSRYVPGVLALLGILVSVFEGICGFFYLLYPTFERVVSPAWYEMPTMLFGVIVSLWILFKGLVDGEQIAAKIGKVTVGAV